MANIILKRIDPPLFVRYRVYVIKSFLYPESTIMQTIALSYSVMNTLCYYKKRRILHVFVSVLRLNMFMLSYINSTWLDFYYCCSHYASIKQHFWSHRPASLNFCSHRSAFSSSDKLSLKMNLISLSPRHKDRVFSFLVLITTPFNISWYTLFMTSFNPWYS